MENLPRLSTLKHSRRYRREGVIKILEINTPPHSTADDSTEIEVHRLAAIVQSSNDAIIAKTLDSSITSWNPAAERIFQYAAQEVIGKNISLLMPKERKDEEHEIMRRIHQGIEVPPYDAKRVRKDGTVIDVEVCVSPIRDSQGRIIGASTITRDVTEFKKTERAQAFLATASTILASSLDYKRTLKHVANLAVPHIADWCAVDMLTPTNKVQLLAVAHIDKKKALWAKQLRKHYPVVINAKKGLGRVLKTKRAELSPYFTDAYLQKIAKTQEELAIIEKIGLRALMMVPLVARDTVLGAITFVSSKEGIKYTKEDLKLAEELARRAAIAIDNARLYSSAQEEIQRRKEIENVKDQFISMASHELKTPVTSIKAFAQLIQQKIPKKNRQLTLYSQKMDDQINRLTDLIKDLLDVSRVHAGKLQFENELFDMNRLIQFVVENIQPTTKTHRLIVQGKVRKKIKGDKDRVGQVLTNLIANAIKYSPKSKKVVVRLQERGNFALTSVEDFGIGIPKRFQDKVFDRFYRVYDVVDKTFPGLGIGLYVSSQIVKRHGGTMWVESKTGKGSTFYFTLPFEKKNNLLK